jgi:hypothetical protein
VNAPATGPSTFTSSPVVDWWFRNRETGEITIGQPPNTYAKAVGALWLARKVWRRTGTVAQVLLVAETGALALLGADELVRGVNPWRRLIGASTLTLCMRRALAS